MTNTLNSILIILLVSVGISLVFNFIVLGIKYNKLIDENEKLQQALKILIETLAFCEKEGNNEI